MNRIEKCLLSVFFLFVSIIFVIPYYMNIKLSNYEPLSLWILLALYVLIIARQSLVNPRKATYQVIILSTILVVISIPITEYYFYGTSDPMAHLGYTIDLKEGRLATELLYPSFHLSVIFTQSLVDLKLIPSFKMYSLVYPSLFIIFIPLAIRRLSNSPNVFIYGLLSAGLLLPVNHISVSTVPKPSNFAIFFLPIIIYTILLSLDCKQGIVILILSFTNFVILHPVHGIFFMFYIWSVYVLSSRLVFDTNYKTRLLYISLLMSIVLAFWISGQSTVNSIIDRTVTLITVGLGGVSEGATSAGGRDYSIYRMFLRNFSVHTVFVILTGLFTAKSAKYILINAADNDSFTQRLSSKQATLSMGLLSLVFILLIFILRGDASGHGFRVLGFLMVFGTLFGAIYLSELNIVYANISISKIILILIIVPSLFTIYPYPFAGYPADGLEQTHFRGFEHTIEYQGENTKIMSTPSVDTKIYYAKEGRFIGRWGIGVKSVDERFMWQDGNLLQLSDVYFKNKDMLPYYFALTNYFEHRETSVYTRSGLEKHHFNQLEFNNDKVYSNGDYRLMVHG